MSIAELLWVEKYRPKRIADIVDQEEVKNRIMQFIKTGNMPHLLFHGPPGTGKTTMALAIAHELYGDLIHENVLELNASDERGIAVIRERVKEFARTAPMGKVPFKLVILDEADNMTSDAQQALRRLMEMYAANTRFILIANYVSRIIEPIQSRCAIFRFRPLPKEAVLARLKYIAEQENVEVTDDGLEAIWEISQGDMRKAINTLQAAAALGKVVNAETVYKALGKISPTVIRQIIEEALYGNFSEALSKLYRVVKEQCADPMDIVKMIHRELLSPMSIIKAPEYLKTKLIYLVANSHYRILRGSDELIQIAGTLAKIRKLIHEQAH